jgi:hypothetical protein
MALSLHHFQLLKKCKSYNQPERSMKKRYVAIFPVILFSVSLAVAGPNLIISEVMVNPSGNDGEREWIEIFNPTGNIIDLTGYVLLDKQETGEFVFSAGNQILSGETLIIAKDIVGFTDFYMMAPDFGGFSMILSNSGDLLKLLDPNNILIDFVEWENDVNGWDLNVVENKSLVRTAFPIARSSWIDGETPSPGTTGLTAVPEPNTIVLLGLSLIILGVIGKFNTKKPGLLRSRLHLRQK